MIIYNTNPVILFKKIPNFGHIRPHPLTPGPQKKNYFKTYYLRPIQYFSILMNTLYFILNVFKNNVDHPPLNKLSVITLSLLLRAEMPKVSCFLEFISRMAWSDSDSIFSRTLLGYYYCCSLICSKYLALYSSIPDFFAFLKRLPFLLISLLKFLFIHGRLCRELEILMECYLLRFLP